LLLSQRRPATRLVAVGARAEEMMLGRNPRRTDLVSVTPTIDAADALL